MLRSWTGFDPVKTLKASTLRVGPLRARGVPAILLGAAGIVLAAGFTRALAASAPTLPETLREFRLLVESNRRQKPLNP